MTSHRISPPSRSACALRKVAIVFLSTACRALEIAKPDRMKVMKTGMNVTTPAVPLDRVERMKEVMPPQRSRTGVEGRTKRCL